MEENEGVYNNGGLEPPDFEVTLLEPRPFRPFKTSEEYLYAMKEDLAEWLNGLYEGLNLDADNFLEQMETGVILCQHANNVVRKAREYYRTGGFVPGDVPVPDRDVVYRYDVLPETFHARDNVSNFISWCRSLNIKECLLFETDDLVLRKNERSFILCLLEVARRGVKFGMPAPLLVQLEQEIDAEIANDDDGYETLYSRQTAQVVTNDLRSLHERVVALLSRCTCPSQFPMIRVADGKYRIGDTKVLIFVRILRSHVMVRVGGGWDTLEHYLDKHDPCRCKSGHRLATSAKLTMHQGKSSIPSMHVTYNRPPQAPCSTPTSPQGPRRTLAYSSPSLARKNHHSSISPPNVIRPLPPPPPPCSDDSSTSSLQEVVEHPSPSCKKLRQFNRSEDESSTEGDVSEENEENVCDYRLFRRRSSNKELLFRETVPSSWRYSPGIPRKEYHQPAIVINAAQPKKPKENGAINASRLPALASRTEPKQPPKIGKVSPRLQNQQAWNSHRSQSSEELFQNHTTLGQIPSKNIVFHSRGSSPVNVKNKTYVVEKYPSENLNFRRNDVKRHSSPRINQQRLDLKQKLCPPKNPGQRLSSNLKLMTQGPRRMFWSPERQLSPKGIAMNRKNSAPVDKLTSPLMEKLLQHSDLCSDENFLKKVEQLIVEFQSKTKAEDSTDFNNVGGVGNGKFSSLPTNLKENESKSFSLHARRSPESKTPSKIPLPIWYPKCQS